jgi:radical SAM superfamily enzyme YgiQ (UPF0313 family)
MEMSQFNDAQEDLKHSQKPIFEIDKVLSKYSIGSSTLLINIPQVPLEILDNEVARNKGYFAYPPQGLLYLAAQLRPLNINTQILDLNYEILRGIQDQDLLVDSFWKHLIDCAIENLNFPVIGLSLMFEATFGTFESISRYIRKKYPKLLMTVGGVQATADKDLILRENLADIVFSNEGEQAFKILFDYIKGNNKDEFINMSIIEGDKVCSTELVTGGEVDVDISLEFELIPISSYHNVGCLGVYSRMSGIQVPFATVIAKRGCRAQCTFCGVRYFNGKGVRLRKIEHIVSEMKYLRDHYQIKHFDWLDDDLLYNREESIQLFQSIARELPDVTWSANNGLIVTSLDDEMLEIFDKSNCVGFKIGLESGNPQILKSIKKPLTLKNFLDCGSLTKKFPKQFVSVNIIIGLPNETFEQMLDSFIVSINAELDWVNYYFYQPLKNTESFQVFGGLSDQSVKLSHGKENCGPLARETAGKLPKRNFNPVRGNAFSSQQNGKIKSGYDIFRHDRNHVPSREELVEIWFTFNMITNFLKFTSDNSTARLATREKFLSVLSSAYPQDPSMKSLLVYFMIISKKYTEEEIDEKRKEVRQLLNSSSYWSLRDEEFRYSDFLSGQIPKFNPEIEDLIQSYNLKFVVDA